MATTQRTFVLIKPDAIQRGLVGEIISRFERKGLRIEAMDMRMSDRELLERHYAEHEGKHYYHELIEFMVSGPLIAMVVEGERCIEAVRTAMGTADPITAAPGSLRGDYAVSTTRNLVHASDSLESADREIGMWFPGVFAD